MRAIRPMITNAGRSTRSRSTIVVRLAAVPRFSTISFKGTPVAVTVIGSKSLLAAGNIRDRLLALGDAKTLAEEPRNGLASSASKFPCVEVVGNCGIKWRTYQRHIIGDKLSFA